MTCTTSVSLSLEGKNLWILKSLPITKEEIYKGKMLFNLLLQIPTALISSALLAVRFRVTGMTLITLFVYPVAAAFAGTVWGLFINLKLPVYNWTNETTVVKQSAASFFALIFWNHCEHSVYGTHIFCGRCFGGSSWSGRSRGAVPDCSGTLELLQESGILTLSFLLDI